ncbi:hypothetical protein [Chitinimonas sp. BJYL2]|uniref:hypothetical protein n=1 Tax=Chitinimonas sp. BJYL2 TaxID=2976696 RepID=UPI0022B48E6D|nr:hypothetical protein [Chitinimonas sp. BJYL2]
MGNVISPIPAKPLRMILIFAIALVIGAATHLRPQAPARITYVSTVSFTHYQKGRQAGQALSQQGIRQIFARKYPNHPMFFATPAQVHERLVRLEKLSKKYRFDIVHQPDSDVITGTESFLTGINDQMLIEILTSHPDFKQDQRLNPDLYEINFSTQFGDISVLNDARKTF